MHINKEFRLPTTEYYAEIVPKTQVYLHHTVSSSFRSAFGYWMQDPRKVGCAYIVDRNGQVYEVFPPERWCHHLGLKTDFNRKANMQSIGIELVSEGGLRSGEELNKILERNNVIGKFKADMLYAFDILPDDRPAFEWFKNAKPLYNRSQSQFYVEMKDNYRGFNYYDAYDKPQLKSALELVKYLCEAFNIPKNVVPHTNCDVNLANNFKGVLAHSSVRIDKGDVHRLFPWEELSKFINE